MGKTINGKSKKQIMEELSAPFKREQREKSEDDRYIYLNIQTCLDRLDEVVGCLNYNIETIDTRFVDNVIYKTVALTLLYDDGTVAVTKYGDGGAAMTFKKNEDGTRSQFAKQPHNTNEAASNDAIKRACKKFRIGLEIYHENRRITGRETPQKDVTGEIEEVKFYFKSDLICDGKMQNSYHAKIETADGFSGTLVISQEKAYSLAQMGILQQLVEISKNKGRAKLMCIYQLYGDKKYPQFIYHKVPEVI